MKKIKQIWIPSIKIKTYFPFCTILIRHEVAEMQIWIPNMKIKTSPHFAQLPSGSWRSYAQKFQLSPHIAARKKKKVVGNSYDYPLLWVKG